MTICKADIHAKISVLGIILELIIFSFPFCFFMSIFDPDGGLTILGILFLILPLLVILIISKFILKDLAKRSSLELTETGINGRLKKVFSDKTIDLPIRQVNSISVQRSAMDYIFSGGGKRVAIQTSSGRICFHCVQNADEFVSAALAQIENMSRGTSPAQAAPVPAPQESDSTQNAIEQIKQLKELKDSGLLTEEEYEEKRKKLLDRI